MTISKRSYGEYSSDNYGAHTMLLTVDGVDVYFSYQTIVAFRGPEGLKVSENCWGPTTGKHLNWIDEGNRKSRLPRAEFEEAFAVLGLPVGVKQ